MSPRFLVLFLPESDERRRLVLNVGRSTNLTVGLATEHYVALVNVAARVVPIGMDGGLVIGRLFHRYGPPQQIETLDKPEAERILDAKGSFLIERYWGSYVALIPDAPHFQLIRDPSGSLPCYQWRGAGFAAFASDPNLLVIAGLPVSIDWEFLAMHYFSAGLPNQRTGLAELSEVPRGHRVSCLDRDCSEVTLWNPWDYVENSANARRERKVERLRSVVQASTSALCSTHKQPILCISGGLDSSIVGATLKSAAARFSGLTVSTNDPDGDERHYARIACASFGVELDEAWYDLSDVDFGRSTSAHLPRPVGRIHALAYDAALLRTVTARGADLIVMGNGGDNVFASSPSSAPIVDRLLVPGEGGQAFATLRDVCRLTGASISEAVAAAYRLWRKGGSYHWRPDPLFLSDGAVNTATRLGFSHSWLDAPERALPGKARHIASLLRIQQHLDGYERDNCPTLVNPLMSQPVIEYCLSIPSWDWIAGGRDRAIAREAFANQLPPEILRRRSKSGPDAFCEALLTQRRAEILERLMEGNLARQGIVDRCAIEATLVDPRPDIGVAHARIMAFLDAEAWIDHWLAV